MFGDGKKKYYPLDNQPTKYYPTDKNFTNFNNVSYVGDSLSKYETHFTDLSEENILIQLNQYNPVNNNTQIQAAYESTRTSPILPYRPDKYSVCVHSVMLPETSIFLFEWIDTITNINGFRYDKYTVSARYWDGNAVSSITLPLQFFPYIFSDINGPVKRVYEINQCIISLNNAFQNVFNTLGITFSPPRFVFDKNTSLISIYCDSRYNLPGGANEFNPNPLSWTDEPGVPNVKIGWNFWVNQWFGSTFPSIIISEIPDDNQAVILSVYNNYNPNLFIQYGNPPAGQTYYEIVQANSSTDLFSTVEKILVTTSISIRPQYSSITGFISATQISQGIQSNQTISILLDFPLSLSSYNNSEISAPISYTPQTYLWQDIITEQPLSLVDYRIFVQRSNGVITPVFLNPGQMCSVKLLFVLR
jgi:hypothetical protein